MFLVTAEMVAVDGDVRDTATDVAVTDRGGRYESVLLTFQHVLQAKGKLLEIIVGN